MKRKIYIAGKVTGEPIAECTMKFGTAQKQIEKMGHEAINPLAVVGSWDTEWQTAMRLCLKAMIDCDAIYLIGDWFNSRGAVIELQLAQELGIQVIIDLDELEQIK